MSEDASERNYTVRRLDGVDLPCIDTKAATKREIAQMVMAGDNELAIARVADNPAAIKGWAACYVVGLNGLSKCKIGHTVNPAKRIKSLQTALWDDVVCHALFWGPIYTIQNLEANALDLAKECDVRLKGEWVNLPPQEAVGLVLTAADETAAFTDSRALCDTWLPPREKFYRPGGRHAIAMARQEEEDYFIKRRANGTWPYKV